MKVTEIQSVIDQLIQFTDEEEQYYVCIEFFQVHDFRQCCILIANIVRLDITPLFLQNLLLCFLATTSLAIDQRNDRLSQNEIQMLATLL